MPTYDYRCRKCRHRFELFHSIKDETPKRCPRCKGRAERMISAGAGILFKGSGFHVTDYRSSSYKEKAKQEKGGGGESGGSGGGSATSGGAAAGGKSDSGRRSSRGKSGSGSTDA